MGDFTFRLAFTLPPGRPLPLPGRQYEVVAGRGADSVYIRSTVANEDLSRATSLTLRGSGFPSEDSARTAGEVWRGVLQRAFAYARTGADFGDRREGGLRFSSATQQALDEQAGTSVLAHRHGLMTFPTDPPPEFRSVTFQLYAPPDGERLATALASNGAAVPMQVREHLAYTLYGSAFFLEASPEARFMMLMMAFESLMKPEGRSPEARAAVDGFVRYIENARDLDAGEQQALIDAIQLQKRESLPQAGMRLAANLGEQTYAGKSPRDFFKHIYKVRGRLAHPRGTGVSVVDVESLLGPLQEFVGDVLAGPALRGDPSGRPR